MKKYFILFLTFFTISLSFSQILKPVKWDVKVNPLGDNTYDLVYTANMDSGWHIYSQIEAGEGDGPLPTEFIYTEEGFELIGETTEPYAKPHFDEVFKMDIIYFKIQAEFVQKIKVSDTALKFINVEVRYMTCDDEKCIADDNKFKMYLDGTTPSGEFLEVATSGLTQSIETTEIDNTNIEKDQKKTEKRSLWTIFIVAFLFGFTALLTPCVFPMIPLTVSFFTKQSKTRAQGIKNAIFYGISIVIIYVFLGWLITFLFGADALNALSTNVWFNVAFFVLLVVFAISFFGAFEITLPQSWANKVDKESNRGGVIGIFFMAMALAIVSFSCTGPIVGTLLVEAASSGGIAPIIGMLGFSLALAIPFMLFAMFPGWLNSLPKSGGWLNSVKVVLGFLELALAFKFLSNADLVLQLHLLEREVFLAIWIAIFGTLTLYLFRKIKLPHDSDTDAISVGRLLFGIVVLTFTIYLIPGLWGAPLKIISGFPPPMQYSESPYGVGNSKGGTSSIEFENGFPDGAKLGPHDIL
ncbi:MAG: thiol:disulfide interchange protein, partial [Flavobacteriales bacterium]|nr:thiol:disulfide interchange protein [Flavobacteriales bacterium]